MYCPKCGTDVQQGAFCPNCGTKAPEDNGTTGRYSNGAAGGSGIPNRSIAMCIILSIVTCGVYFYYWMYCLHNDTVAVSGMGGETSGGMVVLLSLVTCGIYAMYWNYKQGERLDAAKTRRGRPSSDSKVLYLLLSIFELSLISQALMQDELNKMA